MQNMVVQTKVKTRSIYHNIGYVKSQEKVDILFYFNFMLQVIGS